MKLVSVGDLSLLLPVLAWLWSAEAFLAPGCGGGLLESVFCLEEDDEAGSGPVQGWWLWAFFFCSFFLAESALAFLSTSFWSLSLTSVKAGLPTGLSLVVSSNLAGACFSVILSLRSMMVTSWSVSIGWKSLGWMGSLGLVDLTPSLEPPLPSFSLRSVAEKENSRYLFQV